MRTFVMGDIHGAKLALHEVLGKVAFDFENDKLIQLGDVADGWNEVPECVDTLLQIRNLVAVRGNHDVWLHDWLTLGIENPMWLPQGGKATVDAYIRTGQMFEHRDFFQNQVDWYLDEKNRLFIHGGWSMYDERGWKFGASTPVNAGTIAKECHWDREIYDKAKSGRHNGFKPLRQFHEVYIGHTATTANNVHNVLNLFNMDSGAGWNGCLAIMDIDTKEITYSTNVLELYKGIRGR